MATNGQLSNLQREIVHKALPRLYKFALVLTANEELARALLRGTVKALNARNEWREEDRDRLTGAFHRMYSLWAAKMAEDPAIHRKCPPDPHLFSTALARSPLAGNSHFAKFIANLPSPQRGVLYLVYGEGASYDEAAEVAALNMLSLMKLLARGHLALTHWLDRLGLAEDGMRFELDPYSEHERAA
ncbi:MAG: RNA polymerase sigma factor [Rhodomicrobium sp.]